MQLYNVQWKFINILIEEEQTPFWPEDSLIDCKLSFFCLISLL